MSPLMLHALKLAELFGLLQQGDNPGFYFAFLVEVLPLACLQRNKVLPIENRMVGKGQLRGWRRDFPAVIQADI